MKKTLIALAALASTAAFAQSTVTISGGVAAGLWHDAAGATSVNKLGRFGIADNNVTFTAVEDLGTGLKAGAQINVRFDSTNGANGGTGAANPFAQNVRLWVEGGFGKVMFGRYNAPVDVARGAVDVFNGSDNLYSFSADAATRYNGMMSYWSPVFSGFQVSAATALKANNTGATANMGDVSLTYKNGPVYAFLDYVQNANMVKDRNVTTLGGSYDFGVAKAVFAYDTASDVIDSKRYNIGFNAPIGTNLIAKATFEKLNSDNNAADYKRTAVGVDYLLSKRTKLIGDIWKKNTDKGTSYFAGLKTTF